jgi:hypothetical protein
MAIKAVVIYSTIINWLTQPLLLSPLLIFRRFFGITMALSTIRYWYLGWIESHLIVPKFHFKYWGFEWVDSLVPAYLYLIHVVIIISAIGIAFAWGYWFTLSSILFFLGFTYSQLIDLTYYLNHYYFVSCIAFILIFIPQFSLQKKIRLTPRWTILVLQILVGIVYTYAGLSKIRYDWLVSALPLRIWLPPHADMPILGELFKFSYTPYIFSWLGMIYDCTIIFFLSYNSTRIIGFISVVIFHTLTGLLFQIGIFPVIMIGACLIFLPAKTATNLDQHRNFKRFLPKATLIVLTIFIIFQLIFPWRYLLYSSDILWAEEGYRFSWRVMLMEKAGTATFYVRDPRTNREGVVENSLFLNSHQEKQMAMQPDMILQFAHFLKKNYPYTDRVRCEAFVTLNARPSRLLIDPNCNLLDKEDSFAPKDWILRYE